MEFRSYGERLAAAARECRRAQALVDEARLEVDVKERFLKQAQAVLTSAHMALLDLVQNGEK